MKSSLDSSTSEETQLLLASPHTHVHHVFSSSCHIFLTSASPTHYVLDPCPSQWLSARLLMVYQPLPSIAGPSSGYKISDAALQMPDRREESLLFVESLCNAAQFAISLPQKHTAD